MGRCLVAGTVLVACALAGVVDSRAQSAILNLPRASQHARVLQRIGLVDITIDYHRPLVAGRKIFGGLHAYGEVWRAGANENTTIEFSDDVTVEGHPVSKGVYGLHMIPREGSWTVILSKNATSWGSFTYDPAEDALRFEVTPRTIANQEALNYDFDNPTADAVVVAMRWEQRAVPFTIRVDTPAISARSLRNQLRGRAQFEWQPWMEAASYLLAEHLDANEAVKDAEQSIAIEDRFENEMTLSQALTMLGRRDEASAARKKALALGSQPQIHAFARALQAQARQDEANELFRENMRKDPSSWVGHNEAARLAVVKGDFDTAVREMTLAASASPDALRGQHADLVRRLKNHEDINK
jgi:hypothetical protein